MGQLALSTAINECWRQISESCRAVLHRIERRKQSLTKPLTSGQQQSLPIGKCGEDTPRSKHPQHGVEAALLQRIWKRRPRQSTQDCIDTLNASLLTDRFDVLHAVLYHFDLWHPRLSEFRQFRRLLNGNDLSMRQSRLGNLLGEYASPGPYSSTTLAAFQSTLCTIKLASTGRSGRWLPQFPAV